jgi:hypothetical protein
MISMSVWMAGLLGSCLLGKQSGPQQTKYRTLGVAAWARQESYATKETAPPCRCQGCRSSRAHRQWWSSSIFTPRATMIEHLNLVIEVEHLNLASWKKNSLNPRSGGATEHLQLQATSSFTMSKSISWWQRPHEESACIYLNCLEIVDFKLLIF